MLIFVSFWAMPTPRVRMPVPASMISVGAVRELELYTRRVPP